MSYVLNPLFELKRAELYSKPFNHEYKFALHYTLIQDDKEMSEYFSQSTVNLISQRVTELLQGVHPEKKRIVVPDESIKNVMNTVYDKNDYPLEITKLIDLTIHSIASQIRDEFEIIEQNKK